MNTAIRSKLNRWTRKLHRWGALLTFIPLSVVIASGLILQLKKESTWIQPSTERGVGSAPQISFDEILAITTSQPQMATKTWKDIDRLDVRPERGVVKVRGKNRWEIQIDTQSGDVLSSNYRRSDLIESIHDGSWFHERAKLWIFLPNGLILAGLWFTGIYLWWLPRSAKRKKKKRTAQPQEK